MDSARHHYLEQMGIPVWVRRRQGPSASGSVKNLQAPGGGEVSGMGEIPGTGDNQSKAILAQLQTDNGASPKAGSRPTGFEMVFVGYQEIMLVYQRTSEALPHNAEFRNAEFTRFCDDIALSLDRGAVRQKTSSLKWPLPDSTQAAEDGVLLRQLAEMGNGCRKLVLFGHSPASLIDGSDNQKSSFYRQVDIKGTPGLLVEDISCYIEEPLRKRRLWQSLATL